MAIKPEPVTRASEAEDTQAQPVHVDARMEDQADMIQATSNVDAITGIIRGIATEMDSNRASVAVGLLNLTTKAIALQGRTEWDTRDFLSFGVALAAMNQISP